MVSYAYTLKYAPLHNGYFLVHRFLFLYLLALRTLHLDERILSAAECAECAKQGQRWYERAAIIIAAKPSHDVLQSLDLVRKQSAISGQYDLEKLRERLQGKTNRTDILVRI